MNFFYVQFYFITLSNQLPFKDEQLSMTVSVTGERMPTIPKVNYCVMININQDMVPSLGLSFFIFRFTDPPDHIF